MSDDVNHEGLALLLQASRDFALNQLAQGNRVVPFGTRAASTGEIDFVRFVDEDTEEPLDAVHYQTQAALAEQAVTGDLAAAATVSCVQASDGQFDTGFDTAVRIHVEAPGYSRVVVVPFRFEAKADGSGQLLTGNMAAQDAPPAVFAG